MIEVRAGELEGAALDWAVGKAVGAHVWLSNSTLVDGMPMVCEDSSYSGHWSPSTDWSQGGPLIDRFQVDVGPHQSGWLAYALLRQGEGCEGPTPLVACCRAIVRVKLGASVAVPDALIG